MKWRDRNWRGKVAQAETYIGQGEYQVQRVIRYFTAGAVAKILFWESMPWWVTPVAAPFVLTASWGLGYAMNRWGWTKQAAEVQTLEQMSWLAWVNWVILHRICQALNVPMNHIPKDRLPPEVEDLMASGKDWHR